MLELAGRKGASNASPTLTAATCQEAALAADSLSTIEEWRPVVGFSGYEVSDLGRVKSTARTVIRSGRPLCIREKVMRGYVRADGYTIITFRKHGRSAQELLHRIVLTAFGGCCPDGMQCCHADGNRQNNQITNLRWGTPLENHQDAMAHGTWVKPRPVAKLTETQIREIRAVGKWPYGSKLMKAKELGISLDHLLGILRGDAWATLR